MAISNGLDKKRYLPWNLPNGSETIHRIKYEIQKQIAFCPSKKTLFFILAQLHVLAIAN
jgi:hypothetical protein